MGATDLGYLVCEKCGGYYELKNGEAINDFEGCECGGKFKFVKSLDESKLEKDQLVDFGDKSICPNCGFENLKNVKFCGSCGKPIKKSSNPDPDMNKKQSKKPLYCSSCGTENIRTAKTCRSCGKPLNFIQKDAKSKVSNSNKSSKYRNKKGYGILGIGIIGIVLIAFLIVWLPANVFANHYDDGAISFNYPTDMKNSTPPMDINLTSPSVIFSGVVSWHDMAFITNNNSASFADNTVYISVNKLPSLTDTQSYRDDTNNQIVQYDSGQIISSTDKTNPNGIPISGSITKLNDPYSNTPLLYNNMFFEDNNGTVYEISVYGVNSTNSQIQNIANTVYNSIKQVK